MKTLAELKLENAAKEAESNPTPQVVEDETNEAADEVEAVEPETDADLEQDDENQDTEETELEGWMQTDEEADKKFTDGDVSTAKKRLKAKLERKHETEVDSLKAEIENLKQGRPPKVQEPKYEDYENLDNPREAYEDARIDWKIAIRESKEKAKRSAGETQQKQNDQKLAIDHNVDQHYVRAAELIKKRGIPEELYQSSDLMARRAVDSVFPNSGDGVMDKFISDLGPGSEKVFYNIGMNKAKLAEFTDILKDDISGLKAAMYLGSLQSKLVDEPSRRKTKAPSPAATALGEKSGNVNVRAHKAAYDKADKAGNAQARFDARKAARQAGVDVNSW